MIITHKKSEITIYKSQSAGELIKLAACKGIDVVREGNDWKVGDDIGRITYINMGNGYYYQMIIINEFFVDVEPMVEEAKSVLSELAQLAYGYVQNLPIDARKFSKKTLQRAWVIGMIEPGKERKWQYANYFHFSISLDTHVLWEMCRQMVETHSGASIQRSQEWKWLNIAYKGLSYHSERDIADMERILIKLDIEGYIYFRGAGSVWSISTRNQIAA